jgi:hypothetical protein
VIRAVRLMWRSFWSSFRDGYARARRRRADGTLVVEPCDVEAVARDFEAVGVMPREQARAMLYDAMRRYGFTDRDRRHQAGRES